MIVRWFPEHGVIGEEEPATRPGSPYQWIIDPVELTRSYPNHRIFRAAYAHTAVVSGAADVMVDAHNHVWDVAASQVLIEEAGGAYSVVRDFETPGGHLLTVVFGRPAIVATVATVFDEFDGPGPRV
jgi:fructose-1,6-bisphosphatase/inositol monophosphatase family enzyme